MYYSDEYYVKCLKSMLADIESGKYNKVTDITAIGCKDTFSTIGRCAKKYDCQRKYFRNYHFCPFDLRVKLFISNTYVDGISMYNGCFYSCETAHKKYNGLNSMSVKDRIELLIKLVESGKAEKMFRESTSQSGTKDKKLNRKLKQI